MRYIKLALSIVVLVIAIFLSVHITEAFRYHPLSYAPQLAIALVAVIVIGWIYGYFDVDDPPRQNKIDDESP